METKPNPEAIIVAEAAAAESTPDKKETGAETATVEANKDGAAEKPAEKKEENKEAAIKEAIANVDKEIAAAGKEAVKAEAKEAAAAKEAAKNGEAVPKKKGFIESWKAAQQDWLNKRFGLSNDQKSGGAASGGGGGPSGFFKNVFKFVGRVILVPLAVIGTIYIGLDSSIKRLNDLVNGKKH